MSAKRPLGATSPGGSLPLASSDLAVRRAATDMRWGIVGLVGLLLAGLAISLAAAHTDTLLPESVRPLPPSLAGAFGTTGIGIGAVGVSVAMAVSFVCYVLVVRAADRLTPRAVLMTIAALHAIVLLGPPLLSTDMFSYVAYARMGGTYGISPYIHGPAAIAPDSVFPFIDAKWSYIPTAYGPLFTLFSYVLAPMSIAGNVLAYKSIAAVASLATVLLVWNAARLRGLDPVKAAALFGLNPLVVVYGVGGGHNDMLMLAVMIAGLYYVLRRRDRTGGALMTIAAGIKLTGGLLLPFAALQRPADGARRRREVLIGAAAAGFTIAVFSIAIFGGGLLHVFSTLKQGQDEGEWHSIPGFISYQLGFGTIGSAVRLLLGILFLALLCRLLWAVARGTLDWVEGAAWATLALLLTATSLLPWYVAWLLPLAGLVADRRLARISVVLSGIVVGIQILGYLPHAISVVHLL